MNADRKILLVGAVEIEDSAGPGRIRLSQVPDYSASRSALNRLRLLKTTVFEGQFGRCKNLELCTPAVGELVSKLPETMNDPGGAYDSSLNTFFNPQGLYDARLA